MDEFTDTYSDDLIYLAEARDTLLAQQRLEFDKQLCNAAFCRLLVVHMVDAMESCLKNWQNRDGTLLADYFGGKRKSNADRIASIKTALEKRNLPFDADVLSDYLAVKYIRKAITHSEWYEHEQAFVQDRRFPIDSREFTIDHWSRLLYINDRMSMYLAVSRFFRGENPG